VHTVLDLKDAFFSLPLAEVSQPIFAFEWTDLEEGLSGQLTWTRLPQGVKNSPTLFDEALSQDLIAFRAGHPGVDDLLSVAETKTDCREATEDLLKETRVRVSAKKAQLCTPTATYLGYDLTRENGLSARGILRLASKFCHQELKYKCGNFWEPLDTAGFGFLASQR
jgi:hypothetical protein